MIMPAKGLTTESLRHREKKTPCLSVSVVQMKGSEALSSFISLNRKKR